jgi:ankyrin repeat protein
LVKLLSGCGADVNARTNGGYTPLHLATLQGQHIAVDILQRVYGADPNIRDFSGKFPRDYCKDVIGSEPADQTGSHVVKSGVPEGGRSEQKTGQEIDANASNGSSAKTSWTISRSQTDTKKTTRTRTENSFSSRHGSSFEKTTQITFV